MKRVIKTTWMFVMIGSLVASAAAAPSHKSHSKRKKASHSANSQPSSGSGPMVGTWTLRDGDKPRTDIKMVLRGNGTFNFIGPNWKSAGNYSVGEDKLKLQWTSVDGSAVKPGQMHKDFPIGEGSATFQIDKYTYYKLGN